MTNSRRVFAAFVSLTVATVISGCGIGAVDTSHPTTYKVNAPIAGQLMGAHSPITGATVVLYKAGNGSSTTYYDTTGTAQTCVAGYGACASVMGIATTSDGTDGNPAGYFSISRTISNGTFDSCSDPDQLYITSTGGNPGLGTGGSNPKAVLLAALGTCSQVTAGTTVLMNEATTVAAAYALSGFAANDNTTNIGTTSTNTLGLQNAFATAQVLVDSSSGQAHSTTPGGNGTIPSLVLGTVANALVGCVNSDGTGTGCSNLDVAGPTGSATTPTVPNNTWTAALNIALYPANNAANVTTNALVTSSQFYTYLPTLATTPPSDYSVAIAYTAATAPVDIAADASGNIWVSGMSGAPLVELSPNGTVLSPAGGYSDSGNTFNALTSVGNVALDTNGYTWVASNGGNLYQFTTSTGGYLGSYAAPTGVFINGATTATTVAATPYTVAVDPSGNVWYGTYATTTASNNTYGELQLSSGTYTARTAWPVTPVFTLSGTGNQVTAGSTYLNISQNGDVWTSAAGRTAPDVFKNGYTAAPVLGANTYTQATGIAFDATTTGTNYPYPFIASTGTMASGNGRFERYTAYGTVAYTAANGTAKTVSLGGEALDGAARLFAIATPFTPSASNSTAIQEVNTRIGSYAGTILSGSTIGYQPVTNAGTALLTQTVVNNLTVDISGAMWLANSTASNTDPVIEVLGIAAPTKILQLGGGVRP
jgi:hypothetical protein